MPLINLQSHKKSQNDVAIVSYRIAVASSGDVPVQDVEVEEATLDCNVPKTVNKIDFFMDLISITTHNT